MNTDPRETLSTRRMAPLTPRSVRAESPLPESFRWSGSLLSFLYGVGMRLHRALSVKRSAPVATLCVGNLTVGGTGKSPAVRYFIRGLIKMNRRPAVLMRGYKEQGRDEALEVRELKVPVLTGADRLTNAKLARQEGANCVVLDDGLQHWRLKRDLDIVLLDAVAPFGNGKLLPAGWLREPESGLSRAGVIIVSHADLVSIEELIKLLDRVKKLAPRAVVACARHQPSKIRQLGSVEGTFAPERLQGLPVIAACGIGNPAGFRKTLERLGADIKAFVAYDDHHHYTWDDLQALQELAQEHGAKCIVVTEKDAVKLAHLPNRQGRPLWSLLVKFDVFENEIPVWDAVNQALFEGDKRKKKRVLMSPQAQQEHT